MNITLMLKELEKNPETTLIRSLENKSVIQKMKYNKGCDGVCAECRCVFLKNKIKKNVLKTYWKIQYEFLMFVLDICMLMHTYQIIYNQ